MEGGAGVGVGGGGEGGNERGEDTHQEMFKCNGRLILNHVYNMYKSTNRKLDTLLCITSLICIMQ